MICGKVDGNQAVLNAMTAKFATSRRQRCVIHKMENVRSLVPQKQRELVEPELKALFYQKGRQEAEQAVAADHSRSTKASIQQPSSGCLEIWKRV